MTFPAPTNGLNTQARVVLSQSALTLTMSEGTNVNERLTATVTATVEDLGGATKSGEIYWTSFDPSVATVSESGTITAVAPGTAVIEASTPAFGNTIALFNSDGTPHNKVYAEVTVTVQNGYVKPDFYFTLSYNAGVYTITQHAETNSTWNGTVQYSLGQKSQYPGSTNPTVVATITGSGTATFTNPSSNFKLQGTDSANNVYHALYTGTSPSFPQTSIRGSQGGFGVQGHASANSGAAINSPN